MTKHTIKSAVTIALVSEIKTGPWIYWEDLEKSMSKAAALGFDAIELFTPSGNAIDNQQLTQLLKTYSLELAAAGTGAGTGRSCARIAETDKARGAVCSLRCDA